MPGVNTEAIDTAFFRFSEQQDPFNPLLTQAISKNVNPDVPIVFFTGGRTRTRDPLINAPECSVYSNAIICESHGALMGDRTRDVARQMRLLTDPECGVLGGVMVIFPYLEGRDDRRFREDTVSMIEHYVDELLTAAKDKPISGMAVWDAHSPTVIRALRNLYNDTDGNPLKRVHAEDGNGMENTTVFPLTAARLFADCLQDEGFVGENTVVVAPDLGSIARAHILAEELGVNLILTEKHRPEVGEAEVEGFFAVDNGKIVALGDDALDGKRVIIFDDMVDSFGTGAANSVKLKDEMGAAEIIFCATHGIFSRSETVERLRKITNHFGGDRNIHAVNLARAILDELFTADALKEEHSDVYIDLQEAIREQDASCVLELLDELPDYAENHTLHMAQVALEAGVIDRLFVTDSLPLDEDQINWINPLEHLRVSKVSEAEIVSIAPMTALLINLIAGCELSTTAEKEMLKRCIYDPGPEKDQLKQMFRERYFSFLASGDRDEIDFSQAEMIFQQASV